MKIAVFYLALCVGMITNVNAAMITKPAEATHINAGDSMVVEIFSLPSPDEIIYYIKDNNLKYTPSVLSDPKTASKYNSVKEQNIIVGVFMADMAYNLVFDQPSKGFEYMRVIDDIGQAQSLFPYLNYSFKDRFVSNIDNMDSLKQFSNEAYELSMDHLFESQRYNSYALISMGSVVESLHILLNSYDINEANDGISKKIAEQEGLILQLEDMIKTYLDPRLAKNMVKDIDPLVQAYRRIMSSKKQAKVSSSSDALVIHAASNAKFDVNEIKELREIVNTLRSKWIKE